MRNGLLRHSLSLAVATLSASVAGAQGGQAATAPMINQSPDPLLRGFRFRNIGPASMGGRLDDIAVSESSPNIIYLGYAVGGVWKSENNGTTFRPVFDTYEVASIGDIAIHPTNPDIVYVGTGEANNRQTSSFGAGMYKTTDGGRSWTYIGLRETQSIARVVLDPRNPETVYVAAAGHLFGPNEERGIYKSTNGGRTWTKVKYVDENTGFTDLAIDHSNPNVLYAASYQRRRTTCCFNGGGPGSAVWKSTNGGQTWAKLTGNGLPPGTYGRIAVDVSRSNPGIVMVQIEAGNVGQPIQPGQGRGGGGGFGGGGYNWCNNAGPGRGFGGRGGEQAQGPRLDGTDGRRGESVDRPADALGEDQVLEEAAAETYDGQQRRDQGIGRDPDDDADQDGTHGNGPEDLSHAARIPGTRASAREDQDGCHPPGGCNADESPLAVLRATECPGCVGGGGFVIIPRWPDGLRTPACSP